MVIKTPASENRTDDSGETTDLILCGNVQVAVAEVKEQVLVHLLSHGVTGSLAVHVRRRGQMYLRGKQKRAMSDP